MRIILFLLLLFSTLKPSFAAENNAPVGTSDFFTSIYLDKSCLMFGEPDTENTIGGTAGIKSNLASKYSRPLSARVVECIDGTLSNLFLESNPANGFTLFQEFQGVVRPMVILILILYIAINGYLIMNGQLLTQNAKQDIIMFFIKFILVFYFSVGDAWKDFFFVALRSISSTLGTIVLEAGVSTLSDGCIFTGPGIVYPAGKEYIAFFDSLDCKFANYLGWFKGRKMPILVPIGVTLFFVKGVGPFIFAFVYTFAIQLITLISRVAHLYLASIIVLTLLIYASPILIPMALFKTTESIYQNWLKRVIGLTVHPVVVLVFAGILLSITDRLYYGNDPDENDMFKSTTIAPGQEGYLGQVGLGADVNPNCYGGADNNTLTAVFTPIVCVMAWLESVAFALPLPIPFLLEIVDIYLMYRIDIAILFFLVLIFSVAITLFVGTIVDKLEGLISEISGENLEGITGK